MTIGLIFFTLADSQVQPEFDLLGKKKEQKKEILVRMIVFRCMACMLCFDC
jgi:hypothetical protein